jgi:hypothetical protein
MVSQDPYDQLCWAAVALSVDRLYDSASTLELCDVLDKTPGCPAECCTHLSSPQCNHIHLLLPALQALGVASPYALSEDGPDPTDPGSMDAKWNEIKSQIDRGRVVCVGVSWSTGGKHYVTIWGYEDCDDGTRTLYVQDPHNGSSAPFYADFITNYLNRGGMCTEIDKTRNMSQ